MGALIFGFQEVQNSRGVKILGWVQNGAGSVARQLNNPCTHEISVLISSDATHWGKKGVAWPVYGVLLCLPLSQRYKDENMVCLALVPAVKFADVTYPPDMNLKDRRTQNAIRRRFVLQETLRTVIADIQSHPEGVVMQLAGVMIRAKFLVVGICGDYMEKIAALGVDMNACFQCRDRSIGQKGNQNEYETGAYDSDSDDEGYYSLCTTGVDGADDAERSDHTARYDWCPGEIRNWVPEPRNMKDTRKLVLEAMHAENGIYGAGGWDDALTEDSLRSSNKEKVLPNVRDFKQFADFVTAYGVAPVYNPLWEVLPDLYQSTGMDALHTFELGIMEWITLNTLLMHLVALENHTKSGRLFLRELERRTLLVGQARATNTHHQILCKLNDWYEYALGEAKHLQDHEPEKYQRKTKPFRFNGVSANNLTEFFYDLPFILLGILKEFSTIQGEMEHVHQRLELIHQTVEFYQGVTAPWLSQHQLDLLRKQGIELMKALKKMGNVNKPKFHSIIHMSSSLHHYGSALNTTTAHTERKHLVVKRECQKTNRKRDWPKTVLNKLAREATLSCAPCSGESWEDIEGDWGKKIDESSDDQEDNDEVMSAPKKKQEYDGVLTSVRQHTLDVTSWPTHSALAVHNQKGWSVNPKGAEVWDLKKRSQTSFNIASLADIRHRVAQSIIKACPALANLPCLLAQFLYYVHVEPAGGHASGRPKPTSGTSARELDNLEQFLARHCIPWEDSGYGNAKDAGCNIKWYRTVQVHMASIALHPWVLRSCVFPGRLFHGSAFKPHYVMYPAYKDWHSGCTVAKEKMDFVGNADHMQYIRYAKLVGTFTCNTLINPNDTESKNQGQVERLLALVEEYEVFKSPTTQTWKGATQLIKLDHVSTSTLEREPEMRVIEVNRILGTVLLHPHFLYPTVPHGAQVTGVARGVREDSKDGVADGSTLWLVHNAQWQARRSFLKGGQESVPM